MSKQTTPLRSLISRNTKYRENIYFRYMQENDWIQGLRVMQFFNTSDLSYFFMHIYPGILREQPFNF